MITRKTVKDPHLSTISWKGDKIIDWLNCGTTIAQDGTVTTLGSYYFAFGFDVAITSDCGTYAFLYKRIGTKGLLLKHGRELREVNRPYYQSEVYDYPAAFISLPNGCVLLAHCPKEYCRIDFEDVETGEIITSAADRKPQDFFHSRLEVSPDNKTLLSKGWAWHPWSEVMMFDIEAGISNPLLLDEGLMPARCGSEINTASFIDANRVLIGSSAGNSQNKQPENSLLPGQVAIWNIWTNEVSNAVTVQGEFGNIFAIDDRYCWDTISTPK